MNNFYSDLFNNTSFSFPGNDVSAMKPKTNLYWITVAQAAAPEKPTGQKGKKTKTAKPHDLSDASQAIAEKIEQLARDNNALDHVKVNRDIGGLERDGIFSMTAPESFAAKVRQLEGIQKVEQPTAPKKRAHASPGKK